MTSSVPLQRISLELASKQFRKCVLLLAGRNLNFSRHEDSKALLYSNSNQTWSFLKARHSNHESLNSDRSDQALIPWSRNPHCCYLKTRLLNCRPSPHLDYYRKLLCAMTLRFSFLSLVCAQPSATASAWAPYSRPPSCFCWSGRRSVCLVRPFPAYLRCSWLSLSVLVSVDPALGQLAHHRLREPEDCNWL